MTIIIAIIVFILGFVLGFVYWSLRSDFIWLHRTLGDDSALTSLWRSHFASGGGIVAALSEKAAALRKTYPDWKWEKANPEMYAVGVVAIFQAIAKLRRALAKLAFLMCGLLGVTSYYTSFFVLTAFACGFIFPILRGLQWDRRKVTEQLLAIFGTVRLWMEADANSLASHARQLRIDGIVRVIDANESVDRSPIFATAA